MISVDASLRGSGAGEEWNLITPGNTELNPRPRALHCNASGNATLVDAYGNSVEFNFTEGVTYSYRPAKITAASADLVAIY